MARGAPLLATFGLLFTLAGADPPTEVSSLSVRVSLVHGTEGVLCEVRSCAVFVLRSFGTGEKKVNFLEAPLPVSSDEASKSSRLKALRWLKNQTRPVLENGRR